MNSWHSGDVEPADDREMRVYASVTHTEIRIGEVQPMPIPREVDRRYRIQVLLQRSDRPTNWKFNCPHCQSPLKDLELINVEIEAMSDMVNMTDTGNAMIGYRCPGRYLGDYCRFWYYFKLN